MNKKKLKQLLQEFGYKKGGLYCHEPKTFFEYNGILHILCEVGEKDFSFHFGNDKVWGIKAAVCHEGIEEQTSHFYKEWMMLCAKYTNGQLSRDEVISMI